MKKTEKWIAFLLLIMMMTSILSGCGLTATEKEANGESDPGTDTGAVDGVDSPAQSGTSDSSGSPTSSGPSGAVGGYTLLDYDEGDEGSLYRYLAEYQQKNKDSGLTTRGLMPETPETGPVGTWSFSDGAEMPIPPINPLGSQKLYSTVRYYAPGKNSGYSSGKIVYTYLDNFAEMEQRIAGISWWLGFTTKGGDALPFLRSYAQQIGAEILESPYADELIFILKTTDAHYFCKAHAYATRINGNDVTLEIVKREVFQMNREYKITRDMFHSGEFEFIVDMPGHKFTTMNIGVSEDTKAFRIIQNDQVNNGAGQTVYAYNWLERPVNYSNYVLYDFPQDPGLRWVTVDSGPCELTVSFKETEYDLPGYKPGGDGMLVIKNAPFGKVMIMPQPYVRITSGSSGASHTYDTTNWQYANKFGVQNGDDIYFTLPAGYYTISEYMNINVDVWAKSQMIPVSAGEETIVNLPDSWRQASGVFAAGTDDRELTGSISIKSMADLTQTAEMALSVSDPYERDVYPTKENTVITEGGKQVEIVDIRREVAPCSVALVIDSSGSMAEDMKPTLEAASRFAESLPDSSFVKIVDFAGYVAPLAGEDKAGALKALASIKALGSTMLYDATLEGLKQVEGKTRPAVIVFTDGVDSREAPGSGKGSSATKDATVKRIEDSDIPVYTIGFGKRLNSDENLKAVDGAPDIACLIEFAAVSGGEYYPAKNPAALDAVFAAISSKLGNNFVITYNRPTENNISDTPVYSLVIDNSGSMSQSPDKPECNFRMEKTKQLLVDFIGKMPDKAITQFMTFRGGGALRVNVNHSQMSTIDKVNLLKAIGEMHALDGTPIVTALEQAYENIIAVPTSKRVIVFLSDCGLVDSIYGFGHKKYYDMLEKIKDKGIYVLWIGMGVNTPEWQARYAEAAELTVGEYVVSESPDDIMKALEALLQKVAREGENRITPVTVDLSYKNEQGEMVTYKAQSAADFSPPQKKGSSVEPDYIRIETGKKLNVVSSAAGADGDGAVMATASQKSAGLPGVDSQLYQTAPVDKAMGNQAMEMTVKNVSLYNKLLGLNAFGSGYLFAAYDIEMKNITEQGIDYLIPSIFKHFYAGINGGLYPASQATWLMDKPITRHGDPSVRIPAGGAVAGTLVFLIPNSATGYPQQSLHYFDTSYGHIQMPITGALTDKWAELEKLPQSVTGKLSDVFMMSVTAAESKSAVDHYKSGHNAAFQIVEAEIKSNVQALLDIAPAQRVYLRYPTKSGDLLAPMSGLTRFLPFGFHDPVKLGPASDNVVRMAFDAPRALEGSKSELYFDIAAGSAVFGVTEGEAYGAPGPAAEFNTPYLKVRVNQLVRLPDNLVYPTSGSGTGSIPKGSVIADVTFIDKPAADGMDGTRVPADYFTLVNKNYKPVQAAQGSAHGGAGDNVSTGRIGIGGGSGSSKELLNPSNKNNGLIFGISGGFGVYGNMSRRGIVIFDDPRTVAADWTLQSKYDENVYAQVTDGAFASPELIAYRADIRETPDFQKKIDSAVKAAVRKYTAGGEYSPVIHLENPQQDLKQNIDIPAINALGILRIEAVDTEEDFYRAMRSVRVIPKHRGYGLADNIYSPESVLTQGWGDMGSAAAAACALLSRLGFSPELKRLRFTDRGRTVLEEFNGFKPDNNLSAIGVKYVNGKGEHKFFAVPFMADISELAGYVYIPSDADLVGNDYNKNTNATLQAYVRYMEKPSDSAAVGGGGLWGGLAASAGGDESGGRPAEKLMLETKLPWDLLSTDALDLCFMPVGGGETQGYSALLSTPEGVTPGSIVIPIGSEILGVRLVFDGLGSVNQKFIHQDTFVEGDALDRYFYTIGLNLPDLPQRAAAALEEAIGPVSAAVKEPNDFSALKWLGRTTLYRFISAQTKFDTDAAEQESLIIGRVNRPRAIVVTSRFGDDRKQHVSVDLLQSVNEIHGGGDADSRKAFNAATGLFASSLEAKALPGGGAGYAELWDKAPDDMHLMFVAKDKKARDAFLKALQKVGGFPDRLLEGVKDTGNIIVFPDKPTLYDGVDRWAWLEINPDTYETISVFDNGQRSAMVEMYLDEAVVLGRAFLPDATDGQMYMLGFMVGADVGIMSVCSASLLTDDYKEVMTVAKAYAGEVTRALDIFTTLHGLAEPGATVIGAIDDVSSVQGSHVGLVGFMDGYSKGISLLIKI